MNINCESYQINSTSLFNFENITSPIQKWIPQAVSDFAQSYFPIIEGSIKSCVNGVQTISTNISQNFHPGTSIITPRELIDNSYGSKFMVYPERFLRTESYTSDQKINLESRLNELVNQELDKTWQYQLYQRSDDIALAALAVTSSVAIGYGIYRIYKHLNPSSQT